MKELKKKKLFDEQIVKKIVKICVKNAVAKSIKLKEVTVFVDENIDDAIKKAIGK